MENSIIQNLVDERNKRLEKDALNSATDIIDEIVSEQNLIKLSQNRITQLRKQLTSLEIEQLDAKIILEG